jgi:hypothetical protein
MFPRQMRNCSRRLFYAIFVILKESRQLVLLRTSYSLLHKVRTGSVAHTASYTIGTGSCFLGGKRPRLVLRLIIVKLYLYYPPSFHGVMLKLLSNPSAELQLSATTKSTPCAFRSSLTKVLPSFKRTSTRWRSDHCLGTFEAGKFLLFSVVLPKISTVGIATGYGLDDQGEREFASR